MRARCGDKHKSTGTPLRTGVKTIVHKADGTTEYTQVGPDGKKTTWTKEVSSLSAAVHSKCGTVQRKVGYNFGPKYGGTLSRKDSVDDINRGLNGLRSEYRSTGGMSKGGTRKHVASIPEELYYSEKAEKGPGCFSEPGSLMKFADKWGFRVSGKRR